MSDWKKDLDSLLAKVVEDELSATERGRLDEMLLANPNAREIYRKYVDVHCSLQEHLALPDFSAMNQAIEAVSEPAGKKISRPSFSFAWQWGLATAAVFVFLFVVLSDAPTPVRASTIQAIAGTVKVTQPNGIELSNPDIGTPIPAGAIIKTVSADAFVELGFDDNSTMTLSEPASCRIIRYDKKQRSIRLIHGKLWATITPQPGRSPLIIHTPSSKLDVLGTVFDIETRPLFSRLRVSKGTVRMTRLVDNRSTEVHENQEILVSLNPDEDFNPLTPPKAVNYWQSNLEGDVEPSGVTIGYVKQLAGRPPFVVGEKVLIPNKGKLAKAIAVINFSVQKFGDSPVILDSGSQIHVQGLTKFTQGFYFFLSTKDETGAFSGKYYVSMKKNWMKKLDEKGWELKIPIEKFLGKDKRSKKSPTGLYLSDFGVSSYDAKLGILLLEAAVVPASQFQ